ncbi:MAG: hypothetical protein ABI891_03390 [Acidobacteriota bacterium]
MNGIIDDKNSGNVYIREVALKPEILFSKIKPVKTGIYPII